jgi:hypothetical protein
MASSGIIGVEDGESQTGRLVKQTVRKSAWGLKNFSWHLNILTILVAVATSVASNNIDEVKTHTEGILDTLAVNKSTISSIIIGVEWIIVATWILAGGMIFGTQQRQLSSACTLNSSQASARNCNA